MLSYVEYLEEANGDSDFTESAFYVLDSNGIVAGPFDDEGEALWWLEKAVRVS